jgi:single-strand DNA-binding protein
VPVATFTLAVNRPFSSQSGEKEVDFINCVVWRKPAENAANFLKKGSLAGVDGRIQTRSYEGQDGKKHYVTEVVADSVQFLEPKGEKKEKPAPRYTADPGDPFVNKGQVDINDSDLPF